MPAAQGEPCDARPAPQVLFQLDPLDTGAEAFALTAPPGKLSGAVKGLVNMLVITQNAC